MVVDNQAMASSTAKGIICFGQCSHVKYEGKFDPDMMIKYCPEWTAVRKAECPT
jgi:hypothetical protein